MIATPLTPPCISCGAPHTAKRYLFILPSKAAICNDCVTTLSMQLFMVEQAAHHRPDHETVQ